MRHLLGRIRAGHIGTLDPLATGMLPICLGEATKIAGVVLDGRKCYRFTIALGARSATGDAEGDVVERRAVPALSVPDIAQTMQRFIGGSEQVPPMYSAVKQQGQPLYKLARAGKTVERAARRIHIDSLDCVAWQSDTPTGPSLDCRVICRKGTYVRVLAEDLALALGTVGHVTALRREWVEPFDSAPLQAMAPMQTLAQVEALVAAGQRPSLVTPLAAMPNTPQLRLSASQAAALQRGQRLAIDTCPLGLMLALDSQGRLLGLAHSDGAGELSAKRLFVTPM